MSPELSQSVTPVPEVVEAVVEQPTKTDCNGENHGQTKNTLVREPLSPKSATPSASVIEKSVQDAVA